MNKVLLVFLFISNICLAQQNNQLQDWGEFEDVKQEAIQRINEYRKGSVHLNFELPNGQKTSNQEVRIQLTKHHFKWGAVVSGTMVNSPYLEAHQANENAL